MSARAYRPDIDGLRALAVSAVVGYHAFPDLFRGGYVGVDIFFVISGFLIAGIILDELETGTFTFAGFYARRVRRIFPALGLVMAATLAFGWFALFSSEYQALGAQVFSGGFFGSNILFWRQSGYFDVASEVKPLLHLWSLSVEEQFYIFLPLFLFIVRKRRWLVALALAILLASFAFNLAWCVNDRPAAFYSPFSRFWELMLGVLAAALQTRVGGVFEFFKKRLAPWLGLAALAASILISNRTPHYPGWRALAPTLGTLFILGAGAESFVRRLLLGNGWAAALGRISYPLYLWHWPLLSYARIINGGRPEPWERAAAVGAALFLAWLSYRFIERPIRFGRWPGSFRTAPLPAAILIISLAGLYVFVEKGLPARAAIAAYEANLPPIWDDRPKEGAKCLKYPPGADEGWLECQEKNIGAGETALILGDSHAGSAFSGAANVNGASNTLNLGRHGVERPLLGLEETLAKNRKEAWLRNVAAVYDFIESRADITNVFIITRGDYYMAGGGFGDGEARPPDLAAAIFESSLRASVDRLHKAGKKVFVVAENPTFFTSERGLRAYDFVERPLSWRPRREYPSLSKADVLERQGAYLEFLGELEHATIIQTVDDFCPEDECLFAWEGSPLYYDGDHLNSWGSLFQAEHILKPYLTGSPAPESLKE